MKISPPKVRTAVLQPITDTMLVVETTLEQISLAQLDFTGKHLENISLDEAVIEHCNFGQAQLEKLSLLDTMLSACDFSAANCS